MANYCQGCDTKWPPEPVIMLVLGTDWYEYGACCKDSMDHAFVNQDTGEQLTPQQLFDRLSAEKAEA